MLPDRRAIVMVAKVSVADVYTYDAGTLLELERWEAPVTERAVYHMGDAPQPGFSPNTRGRTGKDEHDRDIVSAMHKVAAQLVERIRRHAGDTAWIVLTGVPQVAHAVLEKLPSVLFARAIFERAELGEGAEEQSIVRAAAAGVDALERRRQAACVEQTIDFASSGGRGALRLEETKAALVEQCVQDLFFTERFANECPDDLEEMIIIAHEQSAHSEAVHDPPTAKRLDSTGGGIGALLRFPAPVRENPSAVVEAWRAMVTDARSG
jgi:hypothetical protein